MRKPRRDHHGLMSEDKWPRLRELHEEGLGRNAISREMGITNSVVSRTAKYLGLTFDRTKMRAVTAARVADLAERRSLLAVQFHDVAEESLDRIYEDTVVYSFGGKENTYEEHTFGEAPASERRALVLAAGAATDRSLKLAPPEETSNLDGAKSMLGSLGAALLTFSRDLDEQDAAAAEDGAGE